MTLLRVILFCLAGSAGAALLASAVLLGSRPFSSRVETAAISYATGTLLGAAFLGMIPNALAGAPTRAVMICILCGVVGFFLLEKLFLWRHCHDPACPTHSQSGRLILVGDTVHNFVDGVAIAVAFLHSTELGVAMSIAIIAHEIPQEVGDIFILVTSGFSKTKAVTYNLISGLSTVVGGLCAFWVGRSMAAFMPYAMAVSAASFIYVALADLVPGHRSQVQFKATLWQCACIASGIATIQLVAHSGH